MPGDENRDKIMDSAESQPRASAPSPVLFSIVIPAYNEERRIPSSIRDIKSFFAKMQVPYEVVVVVEKSTDRTLELSQAAAAGDLHFSIVDNLVQRGKGYAVRSGMMRARGEYVFFMDADLSTPLSEVLHFLGEFQAAPETDLFIGNRADGKSQILKKQSWFRRNLGRGFNRFVQLFGVANIKDTQCGFKAFRLAAAHEIFRRQTLDGFAFDVEVLLLAEALGYRVGVLPVRWINSTDSKVRIFIDPLKMLWDLVRIRRIVSRTLLQKPAPVRERR
jgi:dolichyl-phosphate beta-glucosyltransferase